MNSFDDNEKVQKIIKYVKYIIPLIIVLVLILILFKGTNYSALEEKLIEATKKYVNENNINTSGEKYIEATKVELIEGMELCSKNSGVLITNNIYKAYLKCPEYQSKILDIDGKYIKLDGDDIVFLNKNEIFKDPLYTLKKPFLDVNITGNISPNLGVYTLNYDVYSSDKGEEESRSLVETLYRKVIVLEDSSDTTISGLVSKDEPYLELLGDTHMTISVGSKYVEPGYKVVDYEDGKISRQVRVNGEVNTKKVGVYLLTYSVTNSKGKTAIKVRTIEVVKKASNLEAKVSERVENNKVIVDVEIVGNGYEYTKKLDGEKIYSRKYTFEATENKPYQIVYYDSYNNRYLKEIEISGIDDIKPSGSCKATKTATKTAISVDATDNKGISGYNYKVNGHESGFLSSSNYEAKEKSDKVIVSIKDVSGNITDIDCKVEQGNEQYINEKGYHCIYPFSCYKQGDYWSTEHLYCSTDTCGPISMRGCSITSVTTIISGFDVKDKNGELYTPYTLLTDVYNKVCSSYCSGSTTAKKVFEAVGLKVVGSNYYNVEKSTMDILKNHLKTGGAALLRVGPGWYTNGGHLMAILAINEKDEVYLYDPGAKQGQTNGFHPVNTFIPTDSLVKGGATWFQLVSK